MQDNILRKLIIKIEGKEYDIQLQEEFAKSLEEELDKELSSHNNTIKDLLQAYFKKCYDCYLLEKKLRKILEKLQIH